MIVGVYLLFGRLASGEQDWRKQLTDIRSENIHVRWRGALGLSQMLNADVTTDGERLAENRDVATEIAALLEESIRKASSGEDDLKQQEFLVRTLGVIDVDDVTVPVLRAAIQPGEDSTVRKNALIALGTIAYRRHEAGTTFDDQPVVGDVVAVTNEPDEVLRHVATYTLGLFDSSTSEDRLNVLVEHADRMTQFNAAVGLARRGSSAGMPVFIRVLEDSQSAEDKSVESAAEDALMLSNTFKALVELNSGLDVAQKQQLIEQLKPLAESYPEARVRVDAQELMMLLQG
jgi:hypothetical protein